MQNTRLPRLAAVVSAAAAAAASWAITTKVAGVHLGIRLPHAAPSTLGLGRTVAAAAVVAAAGWGALALAERRLNRPRRSWTVAGGAVFLASLALPLGFGTTTSATVSLVLVHLAVAAVAVPGLAVTAPARRRTATPAAGPAAMARHAA